MKLRYVIRAAAVILGVLALTAYQSVFTVNETQQALIVQFGDPKHIEKNAGLHFKLPFLQTVQYYDKRVLDYAPPVEEVIVSGNQRLLIDSFLRYRIENPLLFRRTIRVERALVDRLRNIMSSAVRDVVGLVNMEDLLSDKRGEIMHNIAERVNTDVHDFGITVIDVRIRRVDLPEANSQAIYERMKSEREREARELRAEGEEEATRIRSRAERDRTVLLAEARKKSEILRGEGDGESIQIYIDAFGSDVEFFSFYRSLQAYREAFQDGETTIILSPESDFLRYLKLQHANPAEQDQ